MLVSVYQITQHDIPEDSNLHKVFCMVAFHIVILAVTGLPEMFYFTSCCNMVLIRTFLATFLMGIKQESLVVPYTACVLNLCGMDKTGISLYKRLVC
jgi:hypothetical protein